MMRKKGLMSTMKSKADETEKNKTKSVLERRRRKVCRRHEASLNIDGLKLLGV